MVKRPSLYLLELSELPKFDTTLHYVLWTGYAIQILSKMTGKVHAQKSTEPFRSF